MVQVTCLTCSKEFNAKPSWIKTGYGKYCSRICGDHSKRTGMMVACSVCSKETYKSSKALRGSKSGKFFCSKSCQTKWRNTAHMGAQHANWKGGGHSYRELLLRTDEIPTCTLCKAVDIRILAVHHIDEDRTNNTIENLAWLCHNCHYLVHHHPDELKRFMAAIV